jgi:hypothetical protein
MEYSITSEFAPFMISLTDFGIGKRITHGSFSELRFGLRLSTGLLCALKLLNATELSGPAISTDLNSLAALEPVRSG